MVLAPQVPESVKQQSVKQPPAPVSAPPAEPVRATASKPTDTPPQTQMAAAPPQVTPATAPGSTTEPGPKVAVIVTDLGLSPAQAKSAMTILPAAIGMGFSPYGAELAPLATQARALGHEIWVGIPMQPKRYPAINPGAHTLLLAQTSAENIQRFTWALEQIPGAKTGIYNHMGSAFTASEGALAPVLKTATARGLLFVDARSGPDTAGPRVAAKVGARTALSHGFLDDDPAQLADRLADLVRAAKKDGQAIGLVEPTPASIAAVRDWSTSLASQGVTLVAVSKLTR